MLTGLGDEAWMTEDYEYKRKQALKDRTDFTTTEKEIYEIDDDIAEGGGMTDYKTYEVKQFPYPQNTSRRKVDIRITNPKVGGD